MKTFTPPTDGDTFSAFVEQFSREDLLAMAEDPKCRVPPLRDVSILAFDSMRGGMLGGVIVNILTNAGCMEFFHSDLLERLMDHYGFTNETIPPKSLLRELFRVEIHREQLIGRLVNSRDDRDRLLARMVILTGNMTKPHEVGRISDEELDKILDEMESD